MTARSLNILLTPVGSAGDVHPYIGIGRALRERGHDVTLITAGTFEATARRAGLDFIACPSAEEFEQTTHDPDLWHPRRGLALVMRTIGEHVPDVYREIERRVQPGRTVLVGHTIGFAARIYEEKHRIPAVTLHLAPSAIRSIDNPAAVAPGVKPQRWPRFVKRLGFWAADRLLFDRHLEPPLNAFRRELGLPPVHRVFREWIHSPRRVIGLFPDWFAPPPADWPAQARLTGFPLYDESDQAALEPQLLQWLAAGDPPIAFTPGSANRQADKFFRAAIEASGRLKRRAVLLTRYPQQLPATLPAHVRHVTFAPYSKLLPHCIATVHHGGIGSLAQGLAAGVPQLCMPMGFDQPDNVTRIRDLGVGDYLAPKAFTADRVADALQQLFNSPQVTEACHRCAARIDGPAAIAQTCDLVEQTLNQPPVA